MLVFTLCNLHEVLAIYLCSSPVGIWIEVHSGVLIHLTTFAPEGVRFLFYSTARALFNILAKRSFDARHDLRNVD